MSVKILIHKVVRALVVPAVLIFGYLAVSTGTVYASPPSDPLDDVVSDPRIDKPEPIECAGKVCYTVDEERKLLKIYNRYVLYHKLLAEASNIVDRQSEAIDTLEETVKKLEKTLKESEKWNKELYERYKKIAQKASEQASSSSGGIPWIATSAAVGFAAGIGTGVYLSQ